MTERQPKVHLKTKSGVLCKQQFPEPIKIIIPALVTCVTCRHIMRDQQRERNKARVS